MSDYQPTPPPPSSYTATGVQRSPILSILSLVFGIVGVLGAFVFGVGFLPAVAAVVLGFIGRRKEPLARGMWLTGIILGFVGVVVSILWFLLVVVGTIIAANNGAYNQ